MQIAEIVIPMSMFAMVVLIVFFVSKYNYQTKKLLIENGQKIDTPKRKVGLEFGFTLAGAGVGLLLAMVFGLFDIFEPFMGLIIPGSILAFGGIGLVQAFYIRKKMDNN
jgi:divalent metal cation (Fe/Co/Zn/Cd) transporter